MFFFFLDQMKRCINTSDISLLFFLMVGFNKVRKLENGHFEEKPESNFKIIITCLHTAMM